MTLLNILAFLGFVTGCFILLKISPVDFAVSLTRLFSKKKDTIKTRIKKVTKKKKIRGIKKLITETKEILTVTNKSDKFIVICFTSFLLFILGAITAILLDNMFLVPILTIGLSLIPFWYVRFTGMFWKKQINSELETALSVITSSYIRTGSIITAIDENITYINPSLCDVFKGFLGQSKLINSNIKMALVNLKSKIDNDVFKEWVDAVIACQEDVTLKSTLTPIVSKLSDMRIVSAELDNLLYEPVKEFVTMVVLLIGNIPLLYFLNRDWYKTLMFNPFGKTALALSAFVVFISLGAVIHLSKPIEYRR